MAPVAGAQLACREPTQITVELTTDVACTAINETSITVGTLGEIENKPAAAKTSACQDGRIGTLVLVPAGEGEREVALRVITSVNAPIESCVAPDYGAACIVARRALSYIPHQPLRLPVVLRESCKGVVCPVDETCVDGKCRQARCPNFEACLEASLPSGDEGGGGQGGGGQGGGGQGGASSVMPDWSMLVGDDQFQSASAAAADASGNVYVTGLTAGTVDFGGGPLQKSAAPADTFLASLDTNGEHRWSKLFGESKVVATSVAVDASDNVTMAGAVAGGVVNFGGGPLFTIGSNTIFVASFDSSGKHRWSKLFGDDKAQAALAVAVDDSGNVYVTGSAKGTVFFDVEPLTSKGQNDIFLASFDSNGNHRWSKLFGDDDIQTGNAVAADGSGNVYLTGDVRGTVSFGGSPLSGSDTGSDVFIASFDTDGEHRWSHRFGDGESQTAASLAVDPSGKLYVSGQVAGTVDFGGGPLTSPMAEAIYLASFDASGEHHWSTIFGGSMYESEIGVAVDASGSVYLTGSVGDNVDFGGGMLTNGGGYDIFLASFDESGKHRWSNLYGGPDGQSGKAVAVDGNNSVFVVGSVTTALDTGNGPMTRAGGTDAFIAKLRPPP